MRIHILMLSLATAGLWAATPAFTQDASEDAPRSTEASAATQGAGTPLYIDPSAVRQLQQALQAQGFDPGSVNGQWDDGTAQALRKFQESKGIEATGNVTLRTLAALGMGGILAGREPEMSVAGRPAASDEADASEAGPTAAESDGAAVSAQSGVPVYAGPATVYEIQSALQREGFDMGEPDGVWNDRGREALRNFQRDRGLDATGELDFQTMSALGMDEMLEGIAQGDPMAGIEGRVTLSQAAVEAGGAPIHVSPENVRQVQQALAQEGHDLGEPDGVWGSNTSEAVREYQKAEGLTATGMLDNKTLASLGVDLGFGGAAGAFQAQIPNSEALDRERRQQAAGEDSEAIDQPSQRQAAQEPE